MVIMTLKTLLTVSSVVILVPAVLYVSYQRFTEEILLQLFEYNVNRTLCVLYIKKFSCNKLDFQLDYKRHQNSNYLPMIVLVIMRLFDHWTNQQNVKIFFGSIKLNNVIKRVVAKNPKNNCSKMFKQILNNSSEVDMVIINNDWNTLEQNLDSCNLLICSKDNTNVYILLKHFFNSVSVKKNNNSQLWVESLVTEHLNVELLVLQLLNGYRYVPDVYGTCGQVYFVEDCGHTLQYHLNKMNLNNRLLIAKELLTLALELTDGTAHSNYSFYITDLTTDNIAIQLDKTSGLFLSLKVIDWSDVIIVANDHSITKNYNRTIHISEYIDCGVGCLAYSKDDICLANISDHNIYAICKEFLSDEGALLHGMSQAEEIKSLVNDCLLNLDIDNSFNKSRFNTVKLIITAIEKMIQQ